MSPTAFILKNRHAVWAVVVGIILVGVIAYARIPVRLFPDTAPPLVNIVTAWPGATASDVDQDLTDVLETEFAALEGVAKTSATSQDNLSMIRVEFEYGADVRMAAVDVQNAVSRIGEDLPDGAQQPRVLTFSTADRPIYTVGIASPDLLSARRVAEDVIATRLQAIPGVAAVDVFGGRVPTVLVDVDPILAEAYKIPLSTVAGLVRANNVSLPAGRLRAEHTETMLRVSELAAQVESLADIPIPLPDGGQLRLGDIATIERSAERDDAWFRIDGQRAIAIQVYRSESANTVEVVKKSQAVVEDLRAEFPGLTFIPGEEAASFTEQSVSNLLGNVWQALFLASAILFLFLGRARAALVTAFTMPLTFGLTFGLMWQTGMEFNMVTLSAVILAVGMVVDASVVVLENIIRLRDEGLSPFDAARQGTDEVILPVLAGVATTLIVLVPLLGLPGFVGKVFGPLSTTLLIAFSSSVLVALVLVPILSLNIRDGGRVERLAAWISRPFQRFFDKIRDIYLWALRFGLRFRFIVIVLAVASFVGGLVGLRGAGMDVLPKMDSGAFSVSLETPSGTSLIQTTAVVAEIEALISEHPEVTMVQSQAGFEPGMKFSGGSGVMGPTQGYLSVTLTPRTERAVTIWELEQEVRAEVARVPGIANIIVKEMGNTAKPTTIAPLVTRISGPDPLVLDHLGTAVLARLEGVESVVKPTRTWRRDMRRILLHLQPNEAAARGQSAMSVAQQLGAGVEGIPAGSWRRELATAEPIEVRFARSDSPDVDELLSWPAFIPGAGETLPIRTFTQTEQVVEQGLFTSENLNPVLDINAQIIGRPLSFVVADAKAAIADLELPKGYRVSIEGENNDLIESRVSILSALGISVVAVYLLLVAQFRSWVHPITVMMAVPLSLSGVSLALTIAHRPVSMPVMIGLVLLVGTVVNNSILLIDLIRQERARGVPRQEAIEEGVRGRFRPIMMTTLSTVIGMLPLALELALGAERFSPLATAVIGGLMASTLLTLIVIPVLYDLFDSVHLPWKKAVAPVLTLGLLLNLPTAQAQSLSLADAWKLTQDHPAAVVAERQVQVSRAKAGAATARMFPQAELTARATYLSYVRAPKIELPIRLPDGSSPDPVQLGEVVQEQYALGLTVTQPVFAGGALYHGRRAARAGVRAAEVSEQLTQSELWMNLIRAWYGRAVADEVVSIYTEVLAAAVAREQTVERLVHSGRATELELSAVALQRAEAEQRLAQAERSAAVAGGSLAVLLGSDLQPTDVRLVAEAERRVGAVVDTGPSLQVRQMREQTAAAQARSRAVHGALYPSVALRFGAQYANPNTRYFPLKAIWRDTWDASVVLKWNLDGVRALDARAAKLQLAVAKAGLEAAERQSEVELAAAQAPVDTAPLQLRVAAERVRLAERAVQAANRAVENGRSTHAEALRRASDLAMARAAQQKAAYEVVVAVEAVRALRGQVGPE